jgi:predicted aspartyl protease
LRLGAGLIAFLTLSAISAAAAEKPAPDDPPAGIVPTTASIDTILKRSADTGNLALASARIEDWSISIGELVGTEHVVYSGRDFADTVRLGPFRYAFGKLHDQRWRQNENGLTLLLDDPRERDRTSSDVLRAERTVGDDRSALTLLGETSDPEPSYVVEVKPKHGFHEWVLFDKATGQIDRIESIQDGVRVIDTYDDYRQSNGIMRPWHAHESDGRPDNERDYRLVSERPVASVAASELQIPANRRTVDEFPSGVHRVELPARMVDGYLVVRVNIAGRGLDFVLDSGAAGIVIDSTVATELGLKTYGRHNATVAGSFAGSQTIVPEMDVGAIALHDVVVGSLPFNHKADAHTRIVGLLGFDFIADTTLKLDYVAGRVTALDELPVADLPSDTVEVPLSLDDQVPIAYARVGSATGKFLIDTGSGDLLVYSDFARSHAADVHGDAYGALLGGDNPPIDASGLGGQFLITPLELDSFGFGRVAFRDILAFVPQNAPAFENDDTAGLIGNKVLRTFDLWLDYRTDTMFLAPNAEARKDLEKL